MGKEAKTMRPLALLAGVLFGAGAMGIAQAQSLTEASKAALESSGKWKKPIVTQIVEASTFYPAEEYHQKYLKKRGQTHCAV